jgi:cytosine/adenosine deaminase-related metal-dependent hydrolase
VITRAERVLLPVGVLEDGVVEIGGDGRVVDLRPARTGDPPPAAVWLVPGTVNAHLHLELSWAAGRVPGGAGLPAWVRALRSVPVPADAAGASAGAARALAAAGTVLVCDVSNAGDTAEALADAGLAGVVQHEVLGFGRERTRALVAAAEPAHTIAGLTIRPSPHAVYSTAPDVLVAAAAPRGGAPATIHLAEDAAEGTFLADGTGPFAALLDGFGVDWRWFEAPGTSPVGWLDHLRVLGPDLLVVHGVHLGPDDARTLAARGSPLCLCPRSNRHVGGALPDVPMLLGSRIRLCLGTDSLASAASLDVLDEVRVLRAAFPAVPDETWLRMATEAGADVLRRPDLGRFRVGARTGQVLVSL